MEPEIVQLDAGASGGWFGKKNAKKVMLYFHGQDIVSINLEKKIKKSNHEVILTGCYIFLSRWRIHHASRVYPSGNFTRSGDGGGKPGEGVGSFCAFLRLAKHPPSALHGGPTLLTIGTSVKGCHRNSNTRVN